MTPLFAAANGNPESLNILIEAGANINAQADVSESLCILKTVICGYVGPSI